MSRPLPFPPALPHFAVLLLAAGLLGIPAGEARAAQGYDSCVGFIDSLPAMIGTQGTWCLRKDLSTAIASGNAITVAANNVTIDCNHFKIGGLAAGLNTSAYGIQSISRLNVTVRNCNVRGFQFGAALYYGGGHLVEDNRFDGNTYIGLLAHGDGSMVRRNMVVDTGGYSGGFTTGIVTTGDVDVMDNTISGVLSDNGSATGIHTTSSGGSIGGNRIRGLAPTAGPAFGIRSIATGALAMRGNDLSGNGTGTGLSCSNGNGSSKDNIISGFSVGISNCTSNGGNVVK